MMPIKFTKGTSIPDTDIAGFIEKPTMLAYLYDKIHGIQKKGKTKIHFRRLNILLVLILCKTSCENILYLCKHLEGIVLYKAICKINLRLSGNKNKHFETRFL